MSSSSKGIIVVKFPGKLIPEAVIKKVLTPEVTVAGFAIATVDQLKKPVLMIEKANLLEQELDFLATQKAFENNLIACYFGKLGKEFLNDDIQPFHYSNSEGEAGFTFFLNGPFIQTAEEKSNHSNEFFFGSKYIIPTLSKIYNDCGQDPVKFLKALDDDISLKLAMPAVAGKDHTVALFTPTGSSKHWINDPKQKSYEWGWMSDTCGYEEKAPIIKAAEAAVTKATSFFKPRGDATPAADPAAAPAMPDPPKTDTAIPKEVPEGFAWMSPPAVLTSNSDKKGWYDRKLKDAGVGKLPENWKLGEAILVRLSGLSEKEKGELKRQQSAKQPGPEITEVLGKNGATGDKIVVTSEHVPDPEPGYVKKKQINALHAEFVQTDKYVSDPTKAEAEEKNRQTFDDFKLGSLENFIRGADRAKLETLAMTVEAAVIVMQDMRKALGWLGPAKAKQELVEPAQTESTEQTPKQPTKTATGFFKPRAA